MDPIQFEIRVVPAGTGSAVWDNPHVEHLIHKFMPPDRKHGPMIGILDLGALRPTPDVLQVVVTIGEDVRAGRYGDFTFVVSSEDRATQAVVNDIAKAQNLALFVSSSPTHLEQAEPSGELTVKDRETLDLVLSIGGTMTANVLAGRLEIEQTTAGNRLIGLHKKGYLQRIERPHPLGDLFVDPRSIRLDLR